MARKPKDIGGSTVNEILQDLAIRHGVSIERLKSSEVRRLLGLLAEADAAALEKLEARIARLGPVELQRFGFGLVKTERLIKVREAIEEIADRSYDIIFGELASTMFEVGKAEVAFQAGAIAATVDVKVNWVTPSNTLLKTLARARPFSGEPGSSRLLSEYAKKWSEGKRDAVTGALRNSIIMGEGVPDATLRVREVLRNSRIGAERIARTGIAHITNAARQATYEANSDVIKGLKWVATLDSRTCLQCGPLDGKVFPIGSGPRPPLHFSCFPGDTLVTPCGEVTGVTKRPFKGDFVVIRTAAGRDVTCTPNHLIGTRRGWVAAKDIHVGDQVIGDGGSEWMRAVYDKRDDRKARIHDVAEAFRRSRGVIAREMPTAAPDFHGDGIDGEVGVVWSNGGLLPELDAPPLCHVEDLALARRDIIFALLTRLRHLAERIKRAWPATIELMASSCQRLTLLWRRAVHSRLLLLAGVPQGHTVLAQNLFDLRSDEAQSVCDTCGSYAGGVDGDYLVGAPSGLLQRYPVVALGGRRTEGDAAFFEDSIDGLVADPELFADRLGRVALQVEFDDVVSVLVKKDVLGHVYNLETEKNVYFAGGILAHNCRCVMVPVTKASIGFPKGARASSDGEVPADTTFADWLRNQSKATQEDVLGPTGAKLWKDGKLPLDGFVDKSGRRFTLDELRARNAEAFKRAGI